MHAPSAPNQRPAAAAARETVHAAAAGPRPARSPLGLALALATLATLAACSREAPAPEPVRAVRTLQIGAQGGAVQRDFAAEIRARTESRLSFRVSGKLVQRLVNAGDHVRAGQRLAQLDPADLKLAQDAAQAALVAAQVNHDQTAADTRRYRDLRAQGFISAAELERREAALVAAKSQLDQARAQAGVQRNQSDYAALQADGSGVITESYADPGTVVAAGTPVLRLAHDGPRDVVFSFPEDQLSVMRALKGRKDALTVRLWAGGRSFPATLREIAGAADAVTRTFQAKADLPAGAAELGQTATVTAPIAAADGLLRLPMSALMEQHGRSAVLVVDRSTMKVSAREVTVARPETDSVVLGGGLKPGDVVVTAGAHLLVAGQTVSFYREPGAR